MTDSVIIVMTKTENPISEKNQNLRCGFSLHGFTQMAIHLILPLTFGIFTVVITFHQQGVANKQRLEDRELARILREQDQNRSASQREQDKLIARQQREEDELRRYQDLNISAMRRDLDLHIAELTRRSDDLNAELQRNMSQEQRQHELELEQQRYEKQMAIEHERYEQERIKYQAQLSLSYMNEISNLLEKTDGYLNSNPLTAALARAKTLNVIGQLGSNRSRQLIEFLHDAKQMTTDDKALDLSGAQLNQLDFRGSSALHTRKKLSLVGISLNEATFEGLQIYGWDFTAASLNGANFRYCNISNTKFDQTSLIDADFSFSQLDLITFNHVDLSMSNFHRSIGSTCQNGKCSLELVLSADKAHLPYGRIGYARALIINGGNASCGGYDSVDAFIFSMSSGGPHIPNFNDLVSKGLAVAIIRANFSVGTEILIEEANGGQKISNHNLSFPASEDSWLYVATSPILLNTNAKDLIFTVTFLRPASTRWLQLPEIEINPLLSRHMPIL
ncbi:unnamed protein product [Rotaria sp. Silwood2]|nr:unnamed protein product [Rotaria sp. Silwood2]